MCNNISLNKQFCQSSGMKTIIACFLLPFLSVTSLAQINPITTSLEQMRLIGQVQSITDTSFMVNNIDN